jgi:hypothetical protein
MKLSSIAFSGLALALLCLILALTLAPAKASELDGAWRIAQSTAAPWAKSDHSAAKLRDRTLKLQGDRLKGPGVLNCAKVVTEPIAYPAEGLFQGNLPAPAAQAAQALGITRFPVTGVRLRCDSGVFEFHQVDADTFLLGLDNRVLTLSRAPGALAAATAPEGRVQRLLEAHFSGDMRFDAAGVAPKLHWLSGPLKQRIAAYFYRPRRAGEAPVINGDPFTDSQEYPTRFAVGKAEITRQRAQVPVRFADGLRERVVVFLLLREKAVWQVDDLRYERGGTLQNLLQ